MSCVFKHKESKINTLSELKEQGILDGPYLKDDKETEFNNYHNNLIESVQENYNLGIDKFFNILEQKTSSVFDIVKKFVQPIDNSFKQLDQARKDLGIYDTKESYLSFKEAAEAKSIKLNEVTNVKPGVQELFEANPELANQVYEALGLEKTFNGYNVNNLLNEVINKSKNKDLVYVAKLLNSKDFISKLNILEKKLDRLGKNQVSFIEKNIISNVYIDSNKIKDSSTSFEEVVLHELIHRYTSFIGISKQLQIPISEKENEFYKDMSAAYTIYTEKGFKDLGLDEFIAQSLTNKEVINNLKSIKIDNTNLLERIINFVKKLIDKQTNTLFDFTSASVTNYINNLEDKVIENYYSESELTPQQKQQALQLYSQYLDSVFPDSQVKDIVYHGSKTKKPTDIFVETFIGSNNKLLGAGKGFYFTKDANYSKVYGETTSSIIDIKNPTDFNSSEYDTVQELEAAVKGLSNKGDGVIDSRENFYYPKGEEKVKLSTSPDYIVFKPNQIHILGNKQDIEGFKKFVNKDEIKTTEQSNTNISLLNEDIGIKLDINTPEGAAFINAINNGDIESTNCK
jgi:hypothetical protein